MTPDTRPTGRHPRSADAGDVVTAWYGTSPVTARYPGASSAPQSGPHLPEGLVLAGTMAIRLVYLVIGSSIMTLTTTPNQLTDGLERLLRPLNKLHVPVHDIAMMMSIALRFIPILLEETDKIMKAQQARCADFESGNLIRRMKSLIPILVPLFISAIRRANDLAMAMEARCYHGGAGRTKMKPLVYRRRDYIGYVVILIYILIWVAVKVWL